MSNPLPASLALASIANGAKIVSADHRNNYAAIQTAVNDLIAALSGGTAGQALTAVDSTDVQWQSGSVRTLQRYSGNPLTSVVSSTAETDLFGTAGSGYSLAGGLLGGTTAEVGILLRCEYFNSSGSTSNLTLKAYYGASSVASGTLAATTNTTKWPLVIAIGLTALGAVNAQFLFGEIRGSQANQQNQFLPPAGVSGVTPAILAVDSTVSQNLRVTATHSVNHANTYLKVYAAAVLISS